MHDDPESDDLYTALAQQPAGETFETSDVLSVDLSAQARMVGLCIDLFSRLLALTISETIEVPLKAARIR